MRYLIPLLTLMIAFAIDVLWGAFAVCPSALFMVCYYWIFHRPSEIPLGVIFGVGILEDALMQGGPFGLHAFSLTGLYLMTLFLRAYITSVTFSFIWIAFGLALLLLTVAEWIGYSWMSGSLYPLGSFLVKMSATFLWFPWISLVLRKFQRFFP